MENRQRWKLLVVGFLALSALRAGLWYFYNQTPIPKSPLADPLVYRHLAEVWAETRQMPPEAAFHPPLYPYLLGSMYVLFGDSVQPMLILQNVFGILAGCTILAALLWTVGSVRVFLIGLIFLLQSGSWIFYEWRLYPESLTINLEIIFFLTLWWLWAGENWNEKIGERNILLLICGSLLSALVLLRPNFVLALAVFGVWSMWPRVRKQLGRAAVIFLFLMPALLLIPIMIRNHRFGAGYSTSANTGITFVQGNNSMADGKYTIVPGVSPDILRQNDDVIRIAAKSGARTIGEANTFWLKKGLNWWFENPAQGLKLALWKSILFFSPTELGGDIPFSFERQQIPLLHVTSLLTFLFMTFFSLYSFTSLRKYRFPMIPAIALIGTSFATCVVFYVNNRYRAPAWPIFLVAALFGFQHVFHEWKRKAKEQGGEPRVTYTIALLIGVIMVIAAIPNAVSPVEALTGWHNWGVASSRMNLFPQAERAYQEVLKIAPEHVPTLENLSYVYLQQQRYSDAESVLKTLTKVDPNSYLGQLRMADVQSRRGQWQESIEYARQAEKLRPSEVEPKEIESEALFMSGRRDQACPLLSELIKISESRKLKLGERTLTYAHACTTFATQDRR